MAKQKPSLNQADINLLKKTFATKDDLKSFATKDDLKTFATKDDLKPIKDSLKTFATKDDFQSIKNDLKSFATKDDLNKKLKPIEKNIKKIKDDINMVIGFFDREYMSLKARVKRIEEFLKIPPLTT